MEGSRILILKRANQEGASLPGVPGAPLASGESQSKGSPAGKEKSSPQAAAPPLGRVKEAALALERLAKAGREQEKGRGNGGPGSNGPKGDILKPELLVVAPVPAAEGAGAGTDRAAGLGARDGQEGKHGVHDVALPVESCQSSEGVRKLLKQPGSPVPDTPKSVLGASNGPWGVTLLRPASRKTEEGVLHGGKSEPAAAGGVTAAPVAAGGSREEGGRRSVRNLLQLWTRQEGSASAPASQPKSAGAQPPADSEPPSQPAGDLLSKPQEEGPSASPGSTTWGETQIAPKAPVVVETETSIADQGGLSSSAPTEVLSPVQEVSPLRVAGGNQSLVLKASEAALATPPGVAGVFFRPKKVAWRAQATEGQSTLGGQTLVSGAVSPASADRDVEPGLEEGGAAAVPTEPAENAEAMPLVLTPAKEPGSVLLSGTPKGMGGNGASPTAHPSPVRPTSFSLATTALVPEVRSSSQAVAPTGRGPTSPPPTPAATLYSSPASLKQGSVLVSPQPPRFEDGSSLQPVQAAVSGGPAGAESPPMSGEGALPAPEEALSPVVQRTLLPASSFFSPLSASRASRANTEAVDTSPPSPKPPPLSYQPSKSPLGAPSPANNLPAEPVVCLQGVQSGSGDNSPPTTPTSLPPASPRLASASPFFSPQVARKTSTPGAARSLFSTEGAGDTWGAGYEAPADVGETASEDPEEGSECSEDCLNEVGEAVQDGPARVDSPPPLAASHFFGPRKIAPSNPPGDLRSGFAGLVSSGLSGGYLVQTQEPEGVLSTISQAATVGESDPSDQGAADVVDGVRPISPPPACAVGFFSPSKPAFSKAFDQARIGGPSLKAALADAASAPRNVAGLTTEVFFDAGEDVTPYASANCSPMSIPGSSPGSERFGLSRRVWEVVGEEAAVRLGEPRNRSERGSFVEAAKAVAAEAVDEPPTNTWQSDGRAVRMQEGAKVAGGEKRSELGSSHALDWDSPDHQKVRTPPYRSATAGMGQRGQEAAPALFPSLGAGLLAPASRYPDRQTALALVHDHHGAEAPEEAEASAAVQVRDNSTLETLGDLVEPSGPSAGDLLLTSEVAPENAKEESVKFSPGGMAAREVFEANATPPPAGQAQAAAPGDATPSPSKPGLWSSFVGGIRGMITPPKVTPPKRVGPMQETAAVRRARNGPAWGAQAEAAVGGAFQPTWASPQKERQFEGTSGNGLEEGAVVGGGTREEPKETAEPEIVKLNDWTASFSPTPGSQPAFRTSAAEDTPTAFKTARGNSSALPAGSPTRQRSASPRTPPLASAAFGFGSRTAAPQTTLIHPATSQPQSAETPEPASPDPQPESESPAEVDFSLWERMQMAAIFEHFQGATSQLGARAFFSGDRETQRRDGPETYVAPQMGVEGPVKRSGSADSGESCFELPPHKIFKGAAKSDDCDDVIDPIVRAVQGVPGGSAPLVNYYDVAETAPVETFTGKIPVSKPVDGEVLYSKPLGRTYSGVKKPGKAGVTAAYPWVTDPSPTLTRWLQSDRDEEASFWAPPQKPEPVPNWARGAPGEDGAFVGRKIGGPAPAAPTGPIPFPKVSGDLQALRPVQESPERRTQSPLGSVRTRKGPVPIDQRNPRHDSNKKYFPARVNELRGARGGEVAGTNEGGPRNGGVNAGRDSYLAPAGSPNQFGSAKRGRSASVTDRAQEQRSAAKEGLKAFRSLTPLRFRTANADSTREGNGSPNPNPFQEDTPSPAPVTHSPVKESPAKTRLLYRRTKTDAAPVADSRQSPAPANLGEDKENASEVSTPASDVSKMTPRKAVAGDVVGADFAGSFKSSPDCFDRALSLRDPNREPALVAEYVEMSPKDVPTKPAAAAEAATLWVPAVSDVDPPSAWAHLSPTDLVARPLPSDVAVCRCYVVREHASKLGTTGLYTLFTQEGEGRQDRQLLVARHLRHVGRSEFVIADSAEKLGEKGGPRCVVRANFVGSKYTAHVPDADGKINEEKKLVEIGYATTATSLAPTSRRMLVTLPVSAGAQEPPLALISKPPVFNQEHKRFEINYGGRAKDGAGIQQSVKNFQLVAEAAEDRTLLLFGKVGKDVFVMDFRPPFTATQAFAICLSSVDSKLCCAL